MDARMCASLDSRHAGTTILPPVQNVPLGAVGRQGGASARGGAMNARWFSSREESQASGQFRPKTGRNGDLSYETSGMERANGPEV